MSLTSPSVSAAADLADFIAAPLLRERLGVCANTITLWIRTKGFPKPRIIGRSHYYRLSEVIAYLDGAQHQGGPTNAA